MFDDEKLRVTLNIAGEQVKTVINRSDEEELRMLEKRSYIAVQPMASCRPVAHQVASAGNGGVSVCQTLL